MTFNKLVWVAAALTLLIKGVDSQLSVCGQPSLNTRIVGGAAAPPGSWPWQVSLHTSRHFCGGSLINDQWVLSAAHCFQDNIGSPSEVTAYLGRQSQEGSNPNEVRRAVTQIKNHPDYNSGISNDNDISLLKLSEPVSFTSYISPVCLAASDSTFNSGVDSWITGWGTIGSGVALPSPQNLMEVEVPVVGNSQCASSYGQNTITDNMICAGLLEGGKDACQGDSGGPMVSKQCDRWIQSGIVSFGRGCAEPNFPGVYTRVSQYESWINSVISTNLPGFMSFTPSPSCRPVCGRAPLSSRIVDGSSVASAGEWPWMASLQKDGQHVCGGTLVSEIYVLSDASCFSGSIVASEWTVVLGRLNQNGSNPFEKSLKVANITLSSLTGNNIALLGLASPPTLNDYIQPICLGVGRTFSAGSVCWAAGWNSKRGGEAEALQELQTTVRDCVNASSNDVLCTDSIPLEQSDYGGPLMCQQEGSWFEPAVLQLVNASTRTERADPLMMFEKLDRFESFLSRILGTFLSPASNGGINISHSPFLLLGHLLLHALSIKVLT